MAIPTLTVGLIYLVLGISPSPPSARDIQRMIDTSSTGATITLPPGKIHGSLRIDKPLTLKGARRRSTIVISDGQKAALVVSAPSATTIHIQNMTFTATPPKSRHRGAGVMLSGPGTIVFTNVDLRRTIAGDCIGSALQARSPLILHMNHVELSGHHCYVAGAMTIRKGMRVTIRNSIIASNIGELSGAILMTGGHMLIENTQFRANQYARRRDGQALLIDNSDSAELTLIGVDFVEHRGSPIAFEGKQAPRVQFSNMVWPQSPLPGFVRQLN